MPSLAAWHDGGVVNAMPCVCGYLRPINIFTDETVLIHVLFQAFPSGACVRIVSQEIDGGLGMIADTSIQTLVSTRFFWSEPGDYESLPHQQSALGW